VRYISHELRTPLNAAFLGLKLLTDDMAISEDPKDAERYDTLRDVNLSCNAALDILNDLLCFDKLESGILELHKQDKEVLPFVADCLAMFAAQARESKIKMNVINSGCSSEEAQKSLYSSLFWEPSKRAGRPFRPFFSPPLSEFDSVFIDKFKMDQVVRNLISNALKFTPKGGSINIKIFHLPPAEFLDSKPRIVNAAMAKATSFFYNQSCSQIHASEDDIECGLSSESIIHGHLIIEVSDTGAGISLENQKRLFTDIVQFNPEILQAGGGSGLGLWITKGIVDLHNGKISVHSEGEGKGSHFTVGVPMSRRIPADGAEAMMSNDAINAALRSIKSPPYPSSHDGCMSGKISRSQSMSDCSVLSLHGPISRHIMLMHERSYIAAHPPAETELLSGGEASGGDVADEPAYELLVVDDSRLNRKMLCKILRGAGCLCDEAEDGLQAIEIVKQKMSHPIVSKRHYDAILMDYIMPQLDGPTATKRIRAMNYTAPILGVTGNALDSDVDYFIGCGANKIFSKPFDLTDFLDYMRDM
jgi:signal transduction histidine kinase